MTERQPTLHGDLVALRPLTADDRDALFAVASDPLIWAGHPAHDRWQEPVFARFLEDALVGGGALVAIDTATSAVIGSSRYDTSRTEPDEVEIGWTFLARSHWGGRVNAEMKRLMVGHALQHWSQVIFVVGEYNIRSRRSLDKIGAVLLDRTMTLEMAGATVLHRVYAIDRDSFARGALASAASG